MNIYEQALTTLPAGVVILESSGKVAYYNQAAKDIFSENLEGKYWSAFIHEQIEQACDDGLLLLLKSKVVISLDTQSLHPLSGQVLLLQDVTETRKVILKKASSLAQGVILEDERSKHLFSIAKRVAETQVTVLICGESGTGKEVLARFIHQHSPRNHGPFVAINCAAIPEQMLESILFGHEKGAFTGAHQSVAGKFEQAQKGTLLLDEISEMSLPLQAKLLRVLQEQVVERVGSKKTITLDVRVLATSNRLLTEMVQKGLFREDLYYRLNVFPLTTIPLRERVQDILPLAEYLVRTKNPCGRVHTLSETAKQRLLAHPWPGNIRELQNIMARAMIMAEKEVIVAEDLDLAETESLNKNTVELGAAREQLEEEHILQVLAQTNGKRKPAAEILGISERTLRHKLLKFKQRASHG